MGRNIFDVKKLHNLSVWNEVSISLSKQNIVARPLTTDDFDKGYLNLLSQLTDVGNISHEYFVSRFYEMKRVNTQSTIEHYNIVVFEDIEAKKIVAATTLILELKFIHNNCIRGRIEEVVVLNEYRGKKLGSLMMSLVTCLAKEAYRCYKLSLDCSDNLVEFYEKNNFPNKANMMYNKF